MTEVPTEIRRVGIAGWGRMGAELGRHLLAAGFSVTAFDPDPQARSAAASSGAQEVASVADVARNSELLLVVVVDDAQVRAVLEGPDGAVANSAPRSIIAICASVRPDTCREMAALGDENGVHVIDAALVGGERGAEQASLRLMCGGAEAVIDACRPVLAAVATDVCHIGPVGSGQIAKTANNILLWSCIRADYEVMLLAEKLGLQPGKLRTFMAVGSGANRPLADWGQHRLRWPHKDLEVALAMAAEAGVDMPFTEALVPLMEALTVEQLRALR